MQKEINPGTSGLGAVNRALEIVAPILAKELKPLRIKTVSRGVDTPWCNFLPPANKMLDRNINFTTPPEEEEEYDLPVFESLYENLWDSLQRNEKKA